MEELVSDCLRVNQERLARLCKNCDDILFRPMKLGVPEPTDCLIVYIETAVSNMMLEDSVLGKLLNHLWELSPGEIRTAVARNGLGISDVKEFTLLKDAVDAMLAGDAVFFLDGYDRALKIGSKG